MRISELHDQQQEAGADEADERAEQQRAEHFAGLAPVDARSRLPAGAISWLARPTPMIEPIRACEELLGMPTTRCRGSR